LARPKNETSRLSSMYEVGVGEPSWVPALRLLNSNRSVVNPRTSASKPRLSKRVNS
jgi:hypothetical protein